MLIWKYSNEASDVVSEEMRKCFPPTRNSVGSVRKYRRGNENREEQKFGDTADRYQSKLAEI